MYNYVHVVQDRATLESDLSGNLRAAVRLYKVEKGNNASFSKSGGRYFCPLPRTPALTYRAGCAWLFLKWGLAPKPPEFIAFGDYEIS